MRRFPVCKLLIALAVVAIILPCGAQEKSPAPDPWQSQVNIEVNDLPIYDALQLLFKNSGINFTVAPDITQLHVSAVLKNVSLTEALKAVVKAAGARYTLEKNIVAVSANPAYNYVNNQMVPQQTAVQGLDASVGNASNRNDSQQRVVSRAVSMKNINAGQVSQIIARPGMNVMSTNTNQSVITGPEDQVNQAASIIAALDQPDTLPRPVRISVSAKASWPVAGREPVVATMNPTIVVAEGAYGGMAVTSQAKPTSGIPFMNVDFKFRAQPVVMSDGRISVSGSFAFEWTVRQGLVFRSPDVPITASLEQGKPQNVATIRMGAGLAGREAVLDVTLTASVEKGRLSPSAPLPTLFPASGR